MRSTSMERLALVRSGRPGLVAIAPTLRPAPPVVVSDALALLVADVSAIRKMVELSLRAEAPLRFSDVSQAVELSR